MISLASTANILQFPDSPCWRQNPELSGINAFCYHLIEAVHSVPVKPEASSASGGWDSIRLVLRDSPRLKSLK